MTDNTSSGTSMGDLFQQRRAARKQQQQPPSGSISQQREGGGGSAPASLRDIQAEQEREQARLFTTTSSNSYHNDRRGPRSMRGTNRQDSFGPSRGGRGGGGRQSRGGGPDRSGMPLEQGVIASIKDSFGFIYCADRPDEIFFHFSEVNGRHPADLQMDDEVEFRVGQARKDDDKMAAYSVRVLEPGTIVWETEDEPGKRCQGLVERPIRSTSDRDNRGGGSSQMYEGTIRMLVAADEGEADGGEEGQEEGGALAATGGPLVRFTASDYTPPADEKDTYRRANSTASSSSRGGGLGGGRLGRQDRVEFSLVTERRTGTKYARSITLIQSERERQRLAKEKEMLANATKEQGIVKALKKDYGFLRSNRRREEIYFHYSNVELPEDADENDFVLKEGQDMEFLVLTDPGGGSGRQKDKLSARKVQFLPAGSVIFHQVLAEGVTGFITQCPHPADWSYTDEMVGKVQLTNPVHEQNDDGTDTVITTVLFKAADSPGGAYMSNRDGSAVGLWVREGDTLLFDVVKETVDGTYCAFPTKHLKPAVVETDNQSAEATAENGNGETKKAIRLISMTLAERAEGVIHSIKENYGFIHCAERPVDAYFRFFELLPEEIQSDLRRNMGLPVLDTKGKKPLEMALGSEIQFDLSLQGRVAVGLSRSRHRQTERDNLKAQRILLLPPNTILETKVLAKEARGVVTKEDPKQPLAGVIELDEELKGLTLEERHPLVAKLVDSMLDGRSTPASVVFPDLQSLQEDHVVMNMVETRGNGELVCSHIPVASGDSEHPGRLCISRTKPQETEVKTDENAIEETEGEIAKDATEDTEASPVLVDEGDEPSDANGSPQQSPSRKRKKKHHKVKPVKIVRYDKHSMMNELQNGMPLGQGDVVTCNVIQSRRTGMVSLTNIRVVERKMIERGTALEKSVVSETKTSGVGVVAEVVASRNFGFISVLDEHATKRETLFFHTSSVVAEVPEADEPISPASNHRGAEGAIRKGDEVKFDIGMGKNGKRIANNIVVVPKGTLDIPSKADKNACRGYILMEPSHTSLSNTPSRHGSGSMHGSLHGTPVGSPGGRWNNVGTENTGKPASGASVKEGGSILLLSDPAHMFAQKKSRGSTAASDVAKDGVSESVKEETNDSHHDAGEGSTAAASDSVATVSGLCTRLSYKIGALALQGTGSSSSTSGSNAPRRGDLVSFVKARSGKGVRDIRVVTPGAANLVRGRLENIVLSGSEQEQEEITTCSPGTANFIAATEKEEVYEIDLIELVSCDVGVLKEKESVEGILHEGKIYGVCRTTDLYLESKLGASHKERPRLNLTVRKELKGLGGKIMAQSMMAKGPDGTHGFADGWTKRVSQYTVVSESHDIEESIEHRTEETATDAVEDTVET